MPDRRSYPAFVCPMLLASQERHTADGNLDLGPCCTVPTDLTFGVEIEIWSPKGRDELGEELRACGIDARVVWYTHETTDYWKILRDGTLVDAPKGAAGKYGMELVSPVLRGKDGLEQVEKVVEILQRINVYCCDDSTGLHVHVSRYNRSWKLSELQNICKHFVSNEANFDELVPPSRRADINPQIRSNKHLFTSEAGRESHVSSIYGAKSIDELINLINSNSYGGSMRYFKLNIESLRTIGTIEFRQGRATVDKCKALGWIHSILNFCTASSDTIVPDR